MSDMPAGIVPHLRVPEELFNVQTRMYGQYHVTQPLTFFNNTDRWTVPDAQTNEQSLPSEAYYVVMRMPGEPVAEFLLLQPMIAASRPNMIAWVAARNDGTEYGKVRAYQFPSDTTIFGPAQIEARIDQNPTISGQITLWNQSGSRVIRGNLIVVPVGQLAALPAAGLPAVDLGGVPRVPEDRRGQPDDRRLGRHAGRGADGAPRVPERGAGARRRCHAGTGSDGEPGHRARGHARHRARGDPGPDAAAGRRAADRTSTG